jgi:coenzyme F420-0:L-glutamate ligase/coenzyme F420-1:gamma-L-glutamate ligase
MKLSLTSLKNIPMISTGDNLAEIILEALAQEDIQLQDGDILVLAQKIVSKAEGRWVNLAQIKPSAQAVELAGKIEKDARVVELVLNESQEVLRTRPGTIIVEHKQGFVCANAGIDHSNVAGESRGGDEWVLLLPENAEKSAQNLRKALETARGVRIGVLIIDSHGRAWRQGVVGTTIGLAGMPGLVDLRGQPDLFGYTLRITTIAAADELAAAASLVMGQAAEGTPVVHVRGFPYQLREGSMKELLRPREQDMFR